MMGFYPSNLKYYREALTHRSTLQKNEVGKLINNERLEFLGDAILDAVIADIVFKHFPNKREGFLTNTRAKIVQREHLNKVGIDLGLDRIVRSAMHTPSHNSYLFGNALEALIGAIYLDKGYKISKIFITDNVLDKCLDDIAEEELNYKSRLIEWTQKYKIPIEFSIIDTYTDKTKSPVFKSAIIISGIFVANGIGYTKKESHQAAAKEAFTRITSDISFHDRLLIAEY